VTTPDHPLRQAIKAQSSLELATLLLLTEALDYSPQTNLVKMAIGDELVDRYPEIVKALDRWSESVTDPRTSTDIIIKALPRDVRAGLPRLVED